MSKRKKGNNIRDFIVEWIYHDLVGYNWEEWWDSLRKGCMGDILVEKFGLDYDERIKVWDMIDTHPFIQELDTLLYKWKKELELNQL